MKAKTVCLWKQHDLNHFGRSPGLRRAILRIQLSGLYCMPPRLKPTCLSGGLLSLRPCISMYKPIQATMQQLTIWVSEGRTRRTRVNLAQRDLNGFNTACRMP